MDRAGPIPVTTSARVAVRKQVRKDLKSEWPKADEERLVDAVEAVSDFRIHTIETGRMDYAEARRVGQYVANVLSR